MRRLAYRDMIQSHQGAALAYSTSRSASSLDSHRLPSCAFRRWPKRLRAPAPAPSRLRMVSAWSAASGRGQAAVRTPNPGLGPGGWTEKAHDIVQALAPYLTPVAQKRDGGVTGTSANEGRREQGMKGFEERRTGGERGPRVKWRSGL